MRIRYTGNRNNGNKELSRKWKREFRFAEIEYDDFNDKDCELAWEVERILIDEYGWKDIDGSIGGVTVCEVCDYEDYEMFKADYMKAKKQARENIKERKEEVKEEPKEEVEKLENVNVVKNYTNGEQFYQVYAYTWYNKEEKRDVVVAQGNKEKVIKWLEERGFDTNKFTALNDEEGENVTSSNEEEFTEEKVKNYHELNNCGEFEYDGYKCWFVNGTKELKTDHPQRQALRNWWFNIC